MKEEVWLKEEKRTARYVKGPQRAEKKAGVRRSEMQSGLGYLGQFWKEIVPSYSERFAKIKAIILARGG